MQIITINLPEQYIQAIQSLQDLGMCASRSESLKEYHKNKTKMKAPNETNKTHEKVEVYNN